MTTALDFYARVYAPRGAVAHLAYSGNEPLTRCGLWRPAGWHGTGTQDEYETAAARPLCDACASAVGAS